MPLMTCTENGRQGYRWGTEGACYTHDGTERGKAIAKKKAIKQAVAINMSKKRAGKPMEKISSK